MDNNELFSVSKGQAFTDWNALLNQNDYDYDEACEMSDLAGSWVSCACGNLCAIIPRDHKDGPLDPELNSLGMDFAEAICEFRDCIDEDVDYSKELDTAKDILRRIEIRSAFLIKEILNNGK